MNKKILFSLSLASLALFSAGCTEQETTDKQVKTELIEQKEKEIATPIIEKTPEEIAAEQKTKNEKAIQALIEENVRAAQAEDLNAYQHTLSFRYQDKENVQETLNELFAHFDIDYQVSSVTILELKEDSALIEVVQTQKATYRDPNWQFSNIQTKTNYTAIKEKDGWKLDSMEIIEKNSI